MDDLLVEKVLRTVECVPAGPVVSYGQIGDVCTLGPRVVGRIMSRWGGSVAWWRVTNATGQLPAPLLARAEPHWEDEGIGLAPNGRGCRIRTHRFDTEELRALAQQAWADLPPE
jgi:alkylated DNA nucleotide flippase Atl1